MKFLVCVLLTSHLVMSQTKTIYENGDSSVYLIEFNDTLSYLSFIEPAYSNFLTLDSTFSNLFDFNSTPIRSFILLKKEVRNDSIIYTETSEKFYINKQLTYYQYEQRSKKELRLMVEGKYHLPDVYISSFEDSLYLEVGNMIYIGDLNTTIYGVDILRPKNKISEVHVYTASSEVDFTIDVPIKKKTNGVLLYYEILSSTSYGYILELYVLKNKTIENITEDGVPVRFDFSKRYLPTLKTVEDQK